MKCIKAPFLILSLVLFLFGFNNTAQSAVIVSPGSITICQNTSTYFKVVNTQPASSIYTWQDSSASGWVNVVNNTFLVAINDTLFVKNISYSYNNSKFRCIVDSAGLGLKKDTSALVKLFVYPILPKPIINSNQSICYNTTADTIRVINLPANGLGLYTYQWQMSANGIVWSDIVGKTDLTLAPGILTASTFYRFKASSINSCATLFSDSLKVTVYGNFSPGELLSNQTICFNTIPNAIQFFILPSGAGNVYTYQWQASSDSINFSDIANPNTFSYQPLNLLQTVFYRVNVISNTGCGLSYTNIIRIKVYPLFTGASIAKSQIICFNTSPDTIKLQTNPTGGSGVYFYQWQSSTDSLNWFSVSGQNTAALKLPKLLQTTYIRLLNQCNAGCGFQISNTIKIKVLSGIFTKPRITQAQNICYNSAPDTLRLQVYATGADNKFVYQWQSSTSGTNWVDVNGATALKFSPGNLTQTTYFRINAIGTFGCRSIASDSIKINVYDQLSAGQLNNNQIICYNASPARIQFALAPSGGGDVYSYQWQISSDSINFTNINGALFDTYLSGKLLQTKFYRVKITSINGCGEVTSGVLKIKVNSIFKGAAINADQNVCYNLVPNSLTIRTPATGGDGNYFYQWQIGLNGAWSTIPNANNPIHIPAKVQKETYYRLINYSGSGCGRDTSNVIKLTVLPLPDTTIIYGVTTVCRNQQEVRYGIAQTNTNYTYFWSTSGGKIISNPTDKVAYVNWGLKDGVDTLRLTQINKSTGCLNEMKLPVRIKFGQAPTKSKILRKENSNLLFCSDSTFGVVYQWGFLTKSTNLETDIDGGNLRYVLLPHTFDTTRYEYYLKTSLGACETKSYYNKSSTTGIVDLLNTPFSLYPNPSSGVVNIKSNNVLIASIKVFDNQMRLIENRVLDNTLAAQFKLNAPPGIYFVQMTDSQSLNYWAKLILGGQ
jgi:hypothetical protein